MLAIAGFSRDLLALRRPRSWPRALGLAALVFVGCSSSIALLEQVLARRRGAGADAGRVAAEHAPAHTSPNFVVVAVIAPIVEELTFRGLGYSLLEPFGRWIGDRRRRPRCSRSSHGLVEGFPELALFGCALAWLRVETDSVFPGMVVHAIFNAIALVVGGADRLSCAADESVLVVAFVLVAVARARPPAAQRAACPVEVSTVARRGAAARHLPRRSAPRAPTAGASATARPAHGRDRDARVPRRPLLAGADDGRPGATQAPRRSRRSRSPSSRRAQRRLRRRP